MISALSHVPTTILYLLSFYQKSKTLMLLSFLRRSAHSKFCIQLAQQIMINRKSIPWVYKYYKPQLGINKLCKIFFTNIGHNNFIKAELVLRYILSLQFSKFCMQLSQYIRIDRKPLPQVYTNIECPWQLRNNKK